ncbi:hypothetical protein RINTHH_19870 [Richelia intracellularis HH01]|jgi:hypothetical protein|uniref:Uncharacterized protein n=1 Tax=Richelia intracellularis HH01 TaxID=1165094 RepID=M1X072_9NOST|nr:hypothetical protein RINTHH_19870 [Richelia intracellularis HH01]
MWLLTLLIPSCISKTLFVAVLACNRSAEHQLYLDSINELNNKNTTDG